MLWSVSTKPLTNTGNRWQGYIDTDNTSSSNNWQNYNNTNTGNGLTDYSTTSTYSVGLLAKNVKSQIDNDIINQYVQKEDKDMKYVQVRFKGNDKIYTYKTELDLLIGGVYYIVADGVTTYNNYITVVDYVKNTNYINLRVITCARLIYGPKRPDGNVKNIYINESKKTTVIVWKDGTRTKVVCHPDDKFDAEKGIAMCFMKHAFDDRGCYNEIFKKYIKEDIDE